MRCSLHSTECRVRQLVTAGCVQRRVVFTDLVSIATSIQCCRTVNDFYMGLKDEICFPQVGWAASPVSWCGRSAYCPVQLVGRHSGASFCKPDNRPHPLQIGWVPWLSALLRRPCADFGLLPRSPRQGDAAERGDAQAGGGGAGPAGG